MSGDEEDVCDCCNSPDVNLEQYRSNRVGSNEKIMLCEICASTSVGTIYEYPEQHDRDAMDILKMMAFCTNKICTEMRKSRPASQQDAAPE